MPKVTFTGINETPYWLHKIDVILMRIDNEHKVIKSVKCKKVSKEHDLWEATVTLATSKLRGNSVFKSTSGIKYAVKDAVQDGIRRLRTVEGGEPFRSMLKSFLGWWNTPMYTFYTVSEASRIDGGVSNDTCGDLYPSIEKAAKQVAEEINDYFKQENIDKKVSATAIVRGFNARAKKFGRSAGYSIRETAFNDADDILDYTIHEHNIFPQFDSVFHFGAEPIISRFGCIPGKMK